MRGAHPQAPCIWPGRVEPALFPGPIVSAVYGDGEPIPFSRRATAGRGLWRAPRREAVAWRCRLGEPAGDSCLQRSTLRGSSGAATSRGLLVVGSPSGTARSTGLAVPAMSMRAGALRASGGTTRIGVGIRTEVAHRPGPYARGNSDPQGSTGEGQPIRHVIPGVRFGGPGATRWRPRRALAFA